MHEVHPAALPGRFPCERVPPRIHRVLITRGDKLAGIVTTMDLMRAVITLAKRQPPAGRKAHAQARLQAIMSETKRELQTALPFAIEPVVGEESLITVRAPQFAGHHETGAQREPGGAILIQRWRQSRVELKPA